MIFVTRLKNIHELPYRIRSHMQKNYSGERFEYSFVSGAVSIIKMLACVFKYIK